MQDRERSQLPQENRPHPPSHEMQQESDPLLRTLIMLQRQQQEQLRLLRALQQDVAMLRSLQSEQGTTVEKMDRRLKRARLWQASWLVLRWSVIGAAVAAVIYLIGPAQLVAIWQRLIWLLT